MPNYGSIVDGHLIGPDGYDWGEEFTEVETGWVPSDGMGHVPNQVFAEAREAAAAVEAAERAKVEAREEAIRDRQQDAIALVQELDMNAITDPTARAALQLLRDAILVPPTPIERAAGRVRRSIP